MRRNILLLLLLYTRQAVPEDGFIKLWLPFNEESWAVTETDTDEGTTGDLGIFKKPKWRTKK
jgi:hypothetical protein